ncbi:MAG: hypothetical protein ACXVLQ_15075 [Bacteriovorax sp.]
MEIIFFSRKVDLLGPLAPLKERASMLWYGQKPPEILPGEELIIFFDYDDEDFSLSSFQELLKSSFGEATSLLAVLMSSEVSVKDMKKLQKEHNFIDGFLRSPIKLKDIETFVDDYKLVEKETRNEMEGAKKKDFEDPMNAKIQRRFDLVFSSTANNNSHSQELRSTVFDNGEDLNFDRDISMGESAKKEKSSPKLELNLDLEDGELDFESSRGAFTEKMPAPVAEKKTSLSVVPDDNELDFNLDFGDDSAEIPAVPEEIGPLSSDGANNDSHFELDFTVDEQQDSFKESKGAKNASDLDALFDADLEEANQALNLEVSGSEGTQKTIVFDQSQLDDVRFGAKGAGEGLHSSIDMMSTEEAKANIESTIKDILRPNLDSTQEIDASLLAEDNGPEAMNTPSLGFNVDEMPDDATREFDLASLGPLDNEITAATINSPVEEKMAAPLEKNYYENVSVPTRHTSFVSDEESTRLQATIRQLREEREELLGQIKTIKGETRELEQDNLTLKASLDESKIEISILRKRHMVEMEDIKYRLSANEEKRALAEERARLAESKREKLEQRVRIDFNQVKQREKELETKLEMLSIDVDSQVHSRDQKILELRRKIDALEFNMENVSIKEQKSLDDKRKLEDKLNKIMKTLRHSIKNLEDDIDQVTVDSQDDNESDDYRSNKA